MFSRSEPVSSTVVAPRIAPPVESGHVSSLSLPPSIERASKRRATLFERRQKERFACEIGRATGPVKYWSRNIHRVILPLSRRRRCAFRIITSLFFRYFIFSLLCVVANLFRAKTCFEEGDFCLCIYISEN